MNLSSKHIPLLAVVCLLTLGAALAYGGYIDPSVLAAAPLLFPLGHTVAGQNVKVVRELLAKRAGFIDAANAITKVASDANLDLTAEQRTAIDAHLAAVAALDPDIKRLQTLIEAERSVAVIDGNVIATKDNIEDDPKRGWKSFGEFALAVRASGLGGRTIDERLLIGAASPGATYSNENVGADGGYLVPIEFAREIARLSLDHDAFLPLTDQMPITGNTMTFPSDETTPWGTNGVRVYWAAEAAAATATKPLLKMNTMRLNKLMGLVPVTDEMLADAPAITAYLTGMLGRSIKWKVNDAIINGTGAGQPLGVLNGAGLVVIAKEGGQATLTLLPMNVAKMFAAMPTDYLAEARWIVAPDLMPSLITLTLNNYAIWTPPMTGFANAPGGFLFGKPIMFSQTAAAFSAQGDISFVNLKAYRTISKDGVQIAESMHLYFDYDATAYRATFRVDGQPTFKQAIVQARGAQPLSPYVTLAAR